MSIIDIEILISGLSFASIAAMLVWLTTRPIR